MRVAATVVLALAVACANAGIHTRTGDGGLVIISIVAPPTPGGGGQAPRERRVRQAAAPVAAGAEVAKFPRVSAGEQRARDADRRAILQEELTAEREALGVARGRGAPPDQLRRHQLNIDALQRELLSVR